MPGPPGAGRGGGTRRPSGRGGMSPRPARGRPRRATFASRRVAEQGADAARPAPPRRRAGTAAPRRPARTISGLPPTSLTTTGSPVAMASSSVSDAASLTDVSAKASAARSQSGTFGLDAGEHHPRFGRPASAANRSSSFRSGPSPTSTKSTSGRSAAARANPRIRVAWSFTGWCRATWTSTRRARVQAESRLSARLGRRPGRTGPGRCRSRSPGCGSRGTRPPGTAPAR